MRYSYYQLMDNVYSGLIVRANEHIQEYYNIEQNKWIETGILMFYFSDESDTYNMLEELTEKEAFERLRANSNV